MQILWVFLAVWIVSGCSLSTTTEKHLVHDEIKAPLEIKKFPFESPLKLTDQTAIEITYPENPKYEYAFKVTDRVAVLEHDLYTSPQKYALIKSHGQDFLLLIHESGGTGYTTTILTLFNPEVMSFVTLEMGLFHSPLHPEYDASFSENANDPRVAEDVALLNEIKLQFGYVDTEILKTKQDDPYYAFYFWGKPDGHYRPRSLASPQFSLVGQ